MDGSSFFWRGLAMGFSIAAVVGPIGLLCIHRTLHRGFWYGLVTGMGAATADALYGSVAAFGLTLVTSLLVSWQGWIHLLGGLFLIYLGIRTMLTGPSSHTASTRAGGFFGAYASTFILTLTNPTTILSFIAIFAGLGVGSGHDSTLAALLVLGVFLGSALWWLLLSGGISLLRTRFAPGWLPWINRLAGGVIVLFGGYALLGLLH
jgi:threonine/homoserine/homoserine lactone efflux protein